MLSRLAFGARYAGLKYATRKLHCHVQRVEFRRYQHTSTSHELTDDAKFLPEPPISMDEGQFELHMLALQDTLAYHNLDSYTPAGIVRMGLDWAHHATGLPWWEVIVLGVVAGRLCMFPFTLATMRYSAGQKKHHPKLAELHAQMTEAKKAGDQLALQMTQYQMMNFQRKNGMKMMKPLINGIPQGIYFITFFTAIKRMASAPIESFKTEGIFWFVDLTAVDPTWLLSIVTASTMAVALKTGIEFSLPTAQQQIMKVFFVGIPVFVLVSTHFFPAALGVYWLSSNVITLIIAAVFRNAGVRRFFNVAPLPLKAKVKKADPDANERGKKKSLPLQLWSVVRKKYDDMTYKYPPMESAVKKADETAFKKAGTGPIIATYKYNPREKYPEAFKKKPSLWSFFRNKSG